MDWTLLLAILCLTAASAMADTSNNQTGGNITSPNTTVPAGVFNLVFSINETFDPSLSNTSSPNFTAKAESIRNQIEPFYRKHFNNLIRMVINSFSNGSIVTNSSLEFSSNGTIPTVSEVQGTLVNATNTTSSLNIIASSINVTQVPVRDTTTANTTSTPITSTNTTSTPITSTNGSSPNTPVPAAVFNLVFSINETFDSSLSNTSSPNFTAKAESIRNQIEPFYRKRFSNLIRMVINSFRSGSIVTDSSLEFSSNGTIPTVSEVQGTLVNETSTNSSLNIIASSVKVTQVPVTNTTTNTSGNTSSTNTPSTNTPSTNTPVPAAVFNLVFSINETFDPLLGNNSSPNFTAKAQSIRNQIEPVYRKRFSNFIQMIINSFRNGSIVINSNLEFSSNGAIPTVSEVKGTLVNATNTTSSLNIIASSINVTQTFGNPTTTPTSNSMSPVIASSRSMIWMSLLTLLLSVALHF